MPSGGVKAEEVYFTKKMQNHHGGMILLDGCLYGANGGNEGGSLVCLDFQTGNVLWDGRRTPSSGRRKVRWPWRTAGSTIAPRTAPCS